MSVVDRQGVDQHVVRREAPSRNQGQGIRDEVVMGEHGPLGAPGCARGVEDGSQVTAASLHGLERFVGIGGRIREGALPVRIERFDRGSHLRGQLFNPLAVGRIADDERGLGIADEVLQLRQRVGAVEGEVDGTGPDGGKVQHQRWNRLLDLDRDPVAWLDTAGGQHIGQPAGQRDQIGIADRLTGRRDDGALRAMDN
jgi:hypothetical protein